MIGLGTLLFRGVCLSSAGEFYEVKSGDESGFDPTIGLLGGPTLVTAGCLEVAWFVEVDSNDRRE